MHNANKPSPDELPTSAQLLRSTAIAIGGAAVILVTTVLPAEYGFDPTGVGKLLGLTDMGNTKKEHAAEPGNSSLIAEAQASQGDDAQIRSDEITITLAPGEDTEVKLVMEAGARAHFEWIASGGGLTYDTHGDGGGQFISYQSGSGASGDDGVLEAAFDGDHGWYWGNETKQEVTVTLRTNGSYEDLKRTM